MPGESSFEPLSIELLRALAAEQGVDPADEDLEAVLGFLTRIVPALEEVEAMLPPETPL